MPIVQPGIEQIVKIKTKEQNNTLDFLQIYKYTGLTKYNNKIKLKNHHVEVKEGVLKRSANPRKSIIKLTTKLGS